MRPAGQALEMSDGQAGDVDRVGLLAGGDGAGGARGAGVLLAEGGVANFRIGEETPSIAGRPRQRHERVQVAEAGRAGEQDSHD